MLRIRARQKTVSGSHLTECDPLTAVQEFRFAKREYAAITGRDQGARDVLAYHLRISFKPGEIDAETANRIGYNLALKLTKGNHAFETIPHCVTRLEWHFLFCP